MILSAQDFRSKKSVTLENLLNSVLTVDQTRNTSLQLCFVLGEKRARSENYGSNGSRGDPTDTSSWIRSPLRVKRKERRDCRRFMPSCPLKSSSGKLENIGATWDG